MIRPCRSQLIPCMVPSNSSAAVYGNYPVDLLLLLRESPKENLGGLDGENKGEF